MILMNPVDISVLSTYVFNNHWFIQDSWNKNYIYL